MGEHSRPSFLRPTLFSFFPPSLSLTLGHGSDFDLKFEVLVWFKVRIWPKSTVSRSVQSHSLIWQQVLHQLVLVSEAAERVHALQHVRVDVFGRRQATDGHFPRHGLLGLWFILPPTDKKHKTCSGTNHLLADQYGFSKWCAWKVPGQT